MEGKIYFIQFMRSKRWKIGFTSRPVSERIEGSLTFTSEPVTLITSFNGRIEDEKQIHTWMANHRADLPGKEIFEDCNEVRALVDYVIDNENIEGYELHRADPMRSSRAKKQLEVLDDLEKEYLEALWSLDAE